MEAEIIDKLNTIISTGPYAYKRYVDKFWVFVNKTNDNECWLWYGRKYKNGYGKFGISNKDYLAHRISYVIAHSNLPSHLKVCHDCDNKLCVNPYHLFLGTQEDNIQDMLSKGRCNPSKELNHYRCKLSNVSVVKIRELFSSGNYLQKELATMFKVNQNHISRIISGKRR
jgi:hypothetical protein